MIDRGRFFAPPWTFPHLSKTSSQPHY